MQSISKSIWIFGGEAGHRIRNNENAWIRRVPLSNPGILEMFERRDRTPVITQVPWVGEFPGKYLISAVQSLRMTQDPELEEFVANFVKKLISMQAENGYLGAFPKDQQLLGNWDLWNHYHIMLGLHLWAERTGDDAAVECMRKMGDLICEIYGENGRDPLKAGSAETNFAVIHGLAILYERYPEPRYMNTIQRFINAMEKSGNWLKLGAQGVPYFRLPENGPRWESLHTLQGFAELYRITGERRYKDAVLNLWRSIRDYDRHPSGAFSTNEGAIGTPYDLGSIETCCSIAWMALTIDALKLFNDDATDAADELELTFWNEILGSQHPSGSWWTYSSPMNGARRPSFHDINFQWRPGYPELNCCSVNAPRGLGMLSDWAVMKYKQGIAINFYGPMQSQFDFEGQTLGIAQETTYPANGHIRIYIEPEQETSFPIALRIPTWSTQTKVRVNGQTIENATHGRYLQLEQKWTKGTLIELELEMTPRVWMGEGAQAGKATFFIGPLLMIYDPRYNDFDKDALVAIDPDHWASATIEPSDPSLPFAPILTARTLMSDQRAVILCDFATAGATGTEYISWIPTLGTGTGHATIIQPALKSAVNELPVMFHWRPTTPHTTYGLTIARDPEFKDIVIECTNIPYNFTTLDELEPGHSYFFKVIDEQSKETPRASEWPYPGQKPDCFTVATNAVKTPAAQMLSSLWQQSLSGSSAPWAQWRGDGNSKNIGVLDAWEHIELVPDRHGKPAYAVKVAPGSKIRYRLPFYPENYTACAWVKPDLAPSDQLQQIFSSWTKGCDDPLRIVYQGEGISARMEASGIFWNTETIPVSSDVWTHVAAVKDGTMLILYINGQPATRTSVLKLPTASTEIGFGFNPRLQESESFSGCLSEMGFIPRALSADEIMEQMQAKQ